MAINISEKADREVTGMAEDELESWKEVVKSNPWKPLGFALAEESEGKGGEETPLSVEDVMEKIGTQQMTEDLRIKIQVSEFAHFAPS